MTGRPNSISNVRLELSKEREFRASGQEAQQGWVWTALATLLVLGFVHGWSLDGLAVSTRRSFVLARHFTGHFVRPAMRNRVGLSVGAKIPN